MSWPAVSSPAGRRTTPTASPTRSRSSRSGSRRSAARRYDTAYDRNGADARGIISAFMFRTDRVELLPVTASDPVFGSSPQVVYDTAAAGVQHGHPEPEGAERRPPRAGRSTRTGTDGTNVYTRAPQVAAFRLWRDGGGRASGTDVVAISNHFSSTPQNPRRAAARAGRSTTRGSSTRSTTPRPAGSSPRATSTCSRGRMTRMTRPSPRYPTDQLAPLYEHGLENLWDVEVAEVPEAAHSYVFDGQRADARPAVREPGALRTC